MLVRQHNWCTPTRTGGFDTLYSQINKLLLSRRRSVSRPVFVQSDQFCREKLNTWWGEEETLNEHKDGAPQKYSQTGRKAETACGRGSAKDEFEDVFKFLSAEPPFSARGQTLLFHVLSCSSGSKAAAVVVVVLVWVWTGKSVPTIIAG